MSLMGEVYNIMIFNLIPKTHNPIPNEVT